MWLCLSISDWEIKLFWQESPVRPWALPAAGRTQAATASLKLATNNISHAVVQAQDPLLDYLNTVATYTSLTNDWKWRELNSFFVRRFSPSTRQSKSSLLSNHLVITSDDIRLFSSDYLFYWLRDTQSQCPIDPTLRWGGMIGEEWPRVLRYLH
jgi:hypothetical protein